MNRYLSTPYQGMNFQQAIVLRLDFRRVVGTFGAGPGPGVLVLHVHAAVVVGGQLASLEDASPRLLVLLLALLKTFRLPVQQATVRVRQQTLSALVKAVRVPLQNRLSRLVQRLADQCVE